MRYMNPLVLISVLTLALGSCHSVLHPPKKTFNKNIVKQPFDAIIVPGFPYDGEYWDKVMMIRVQWAKMLIDSGYTKNIIFSGGAVYTPYVESKVMFEHAKAMGIPESKMYIESNAEHSTENVYYSYRIAKEKGFKNIALATDPYQLKNLRSFIRKYDLPIALLPIVFSQLTQTERLDPKPNCENAKISPFVSLPERESLLTRLQGTFGKHICWYPEDIKSSKLKKKLAQKGRLIQ